jgi:PhzF family phenazine biosynthesis protein
MQEPVFFVNAFAEGFYRGNTAAVVVLDKYPEDQEMLALAKEFGFSETAFLVRSGKATYHLRWWTPEVEVPLCGHATLASAASLFSSAEKETDLLTFRSRSGILSARRAGEQIELNFPVERPVPHDTDQEIVEALAQGQPLETMSARQSRNLVYVYPSYQTVLDMKPDFARLKNIDPVPCFGIVVTAPGKDTDYICRYFAPWEGISEDPVTGSAQTYLAPYWAKRLGKNELSGFQASERGGAFSIDVLDTRVLIRGKAFIYMHGWLESNWRKVNPGSGETNNY